MRIQYLRCRYESSGLVDRIYTFKAPPGLELERGDLVIAESRDGYGLLRVIGPAEPPIPPIPLKWVLARVDEDDLRARREIIAEHSD